MSVENLSEVDPQKGSGSKRYRGNGRTSWWEIHWDLLVPLDLIAIEAMAHEDGTFFRLVSLSRYDASLCAMSF